MISLQKDNYHFKKSLLFSFIIFHIQSTERGLIYHAKPINCTTYSINLIYKKTAGYYMSLHTESFIEKLW